MTRAGLEKIARENGWKLWISCYRRGNKYVWTGKNSLEHSDFPNSIIYSDKQPDIATLIVREHNE